jgi:hypothetical protein
VGRAFVARVLLPLLVCMGLAVAGSSGTALAAVTNDVGDSILPSQLCADDDAPSRAIDVVIEPECEDDRDDSSDTEAGFAAAHVGAGAVGSAWLAAATDMRRRRRASIALGRGPPQRVR